MRLVELGIVGKPHGFRGEFVAHTDAGRASALETASQLFIGTSADSAQPYQVLEAAWMPKGWKLKLAGIESEDLVRSLRGHSVYLEREALPPTEQDEFYLSDLVGSVVRDEATGEDIGTCSGVETLGAGVHDRWVIDPKDGGESLVVPAVKRYVARVDVAAKVIWLRNLSDFK